MKIFEDGSKPGDSERNRWEQFPKGLKGKIISRDELNEIFPKEGNWSKIKVISANKAYTVYGRRKKDGLKFDLPLAYDCNNCDNIILGPPRIEDDESINDGVPLSGSLGYDSYCTNCDHRLGGQVFMQS